MKWLGKYIGAAFVLAVLNLTVSACPWCRVQVRGGVYDGGFLGNLFVLLLPIVILAALGFGLYHADEILCRIRRMKR